MKTSPGPLDVSMGCAGDQGDTGPLGHRGDPGAMLSWTHPRPPGEFSTGAAPSAGALPHPSGTAKRLSSGGEIRA